MDSISSSPTARDTRRHVARRRKLSADPRLPSTRPAGRRCGSTTSRSTGQLQGERRVLRRFSGGSLRTTRAARRADDRRCRRHHHPRRQPARPSFATTASRPRARIDHISYGIAPWDTDRVKAELERRGLKPTIDTSDGNEIHVAQFKSYHVFTPNGYNLQISYNTHDTRLNLAISVNPRRPGIR